MRQLYTVAKASFWMFFVKAIGMGAAFFITVIVGRNLGAAVLGDYGLALTIVAVLGIVTKFGTDKNIVRTISGFEPSEDNDRLPQFLVSYYVSAVCLCALITLVLYSGAGILSFLIAASDRNKELFQLASLALLSNTLIATSSGILQARKHYFLSILFQLTTHQLILLAILAFSISKIDSATSLLLCYIVANYVTLIACLLTIKKINSPVGISRQALRSYLSNGFKFHLDSRYLFSATAGGYLLGFIDILVISYFYDSATLGVYIVVTRIGNTVGSVLSTLNTYIAPNIASLDREFNIPKIRNLVFLCSILAGFTAIIFVVTLWVFGVEILGIFGDEFKSGYTALLFVGLAQLINAVFGPCGQVMQMTNMQPLIVRIMLVTVISNLILNIIFVPIYGLAGAAFTTMLTNLLANAWQFKHVYYGYFKRVRP